MKYVLFSDLHGNVDALHAMLRAVKNQSIDGYIFCGDLTGYYYDAPKIVEILSSLQPLYIVKGNHDEMYLRLAHQQLEPLPLIEKYGHCYEQLCPEVVDYIAALPEKLECSLAEHRVLLVHGAPHDPINGRIYPDTVLDGMAPENIDYVICGHTHYRMCRKWEHCTLINPGSLGQPRDGKGFSYCIFEPDIGELTFYSVEFDLSHLYQKIARYDSGHPYLRSIFDRKGKEIL